MPPSGKTTVYCFLFAFLASELNVQYKLIDCIIGIEIEIEIEFSTSRTIMDEYLNVL